VLLVLILAIDVNNCVSKTHVDKRVGACATPRPIFKGNISVAIVCYWKTIKINGGVECMSAWKTRDSRRISDRSLLDRHHVDGRLSLYHDRDDGGDCIHNINCSVLTRTWAGGGRRYTQDHWSVSVFATLQWSCLLNTTTEAWRTPL